MVIVIDLFRKMGVSTLLVTAQGRLLGTIKIILQKKNANNNLNNFRNNYKKRYFKSYSFPN
jgi:hypothetical protein